MKASVPEGIVAERFKKTVIEEEAQASPPTTFARKTAPPLQSPTSHVLADTVEKPLAVATGAR